MFSGDKVFPTRQRADVGRAAWATWADRDVLSAESIDSLPDKQREPTEAEGMCMYFCAFLPALQKTYQSWLPGVEHIFITDYVLINRLRLSESICSTYRDPHHSGEEYMNGSAHIMNGPVKVDRNNT